MTGLYLGVIAVMSRRHRTYGYLQKMKFILGCLVVGLMACGSGDGGGDEFCDGGDCVCPAGADCIVDCPAGVDCDVQVQSGAAVDVACGDSISCDVECSAAATCDVDCANGDCDVTCPDDSCTVTNCPEATCDVLCGLGGLPTRSGNTATCP